MQRPNPPDHVLHGVRVLVVEDKRVVAEALKFLLEDVGMIVLGPASTSDAAKELFADRPHLALVDMLLGGDTGYALIRRLGEIKVPVLAMSGSIELLARISNISTIQKPFSGQELLQAIHQLVPAPATE